MDRQSIRLQIPHPGEPGSILVGILEQVHGTGGNKSTERSVPRDTGSGEEENRKLALVRLQVTPI